MNTTKTKNYYKDVTDDWLKNSNPNSKELVFDNSFIDEEGVVHPIHKLECKHAIPRKGDEYDMANIIKEVFGGDIHLVPRISDISNLGIRTKTPDYLWNGEKWDLKTPGANGNFKNTFERFLKKSDAKKQVKNFIIDYKRFPEKTEQEIMKAIFNTLRNPSRRWVEKVMVIKNNTIIAIICKV